MNALCQRHSDSGLTLPASKSGFTFCFRAAHLQRLLPHIQQEPRSCPTNERQPHHQTSTLLKKGPRTPWQWKDFTMSILNSKSNAAAISLLPQVLASCGCQRLPLPAQQTVRHASRLDDLPLGIFYLVRRTNKQQFRAGRYIPAFQAGCPRMACLAEQAEPHLAILCTCCLALLRFNGA